MIDKKRLRTFPELLRPQDVAKLLGVDARTVSRWAREGKLRSIRTIGGHRRYYREDFEAFIPPQAEDEK